MNIVRLLRSQAGITQKDLAARANTSQPTIAAYENGAKSPTVATVRRLASSLGLDLVVSFTPEMTREDRRSLAYHQAIADKLRVDSVAPVRKAGRTLNRMSVQHPDAVVLFRLWKSWLRLPTDDLIAKMLDPGLIARDMRQVSPFAGILSARERVEVLARFRKAYAP